MYQRVPDMIPSVGEVPVTSTAESVVATPIDFKPRSIASPYYKHLKVPLHNISQSSITIGPTTNTMLEWKLPTKVYNLARSYIEYTIHIPAVAAKRIATHEDVFDLGSSITFGAAGGLDLVNLQWAQNYSKIRRKIDTPLDEYLINDETSGLYKSGRPVEDIQYTANFVAAGPTATNLVYVSNKVPYVDAAGKSPTGGEYQGAAAMMENVYCKFGATATEVYAHRRLPLGMFTGTLLGLDRDFYGGTQEMYLRVNAGTGDKIAFSTTDNIKPGTGAASVPTLTINNVSLYLAVEQNPAITAEFMNKFVAGTLRYTIPYTQSFKNPGGASGTVSNIPIPLSQQYGKRLKRIIHTVWDPTEKIHSAYDCNNHNGIKITNYQTLLDSIPLQDRILSCAVPYQNQLNGDDWLENKKFLKNSMILNKGHYSLNWFHMDSFVEPDVREGNVPDVNFVDEGLSMVTARNWQISTLNNAANLVHYTFAEFSRVIDVTPVGVMFV